MNTPRVALVISAEPHLSVGAQRPQDIDGVIGWVDLCGITIQSRTPAYLRAVAQAFTDAADRAEILAQEVAP